MATIDLCGQWRLKGGEHDLTGNVPGDITDDLLRAGIISDPYVGYNYADCLWVQKQEWSYEREFDLARGLSDKQIRLVLKGVDTFSEVYINGRLVGKTESMHLEYRFPVRPFLHAGKNTVRVRMLPVFDKMGEKPQEKYESVFNANRIFVRKAQCHFGWDWAPKFPGYGIYREVYLESYGEDEIEEVKVVPHTDGEVNFFVRCTRAPHGRLTLSVSCEGQTAAVLDVPAEDSKKLINVRIEKPRLWWPNGYGEQALYTYKLTLTKDGQTLSEKEGRFGIREISLDKSMTDAQNSRFAFRVNGRTVFARGSNWVPADMMTGRITAERYGALLSAAKRANFNMLRVWGGGIYESDLFYDLCDEYGILIWQDFMFACQEIPDDIPEFANTIGEEAAFQVKRLRNQPCVAYWCGINETRSSFNRLEIRYGEYALNILLRGICAHYDGTRPYERCSPTGFADIENDACYGDAHNNVSETFLYGTSFKGFEEYDYGERDEKSAIMQRTRNYYRYLEETANNFSSECAVIGACSYKSLLKFLPGNKDTGVDDPFFKDRFLGNPYSHVMPSFIERQTIIAEALYGEIKDLMDFAKKANAAQAEIMAAEIVHARTNGRSHGFLNWMYNDIWPTGTWSVIDYYLDKKPAYYAMKRCFAPTAMQFCRLGDKISLRVMSDTQAFCAEIEYGVKTYGGKIVRSERKRLASECGGVAVFDVGFPLEEGDYLYAKGGGLSAVYNLRRFTDMKYEPRYAFSVKQVSGNEAEAVLRAETFVPCVRILTDGEPEDNYFDLDAGEEKRVRIRGSAVRADAVSFFDVWAE